MRGMGSDHVISGPMRGLEKNSIQWRTHTNTHTHTDGHRDSKTDLGQRADSVKKLDGVGPVDNRPSDD